MGRRVMLQPAVGQRLIGADVSTLTDGQMDLADSGLPDVHRLVTDVRASMTRSQRPGEPGDRGRRHGDRAAEAAAGGQGRDLSSTPS